MSQRTLRPVSLLVLMLTLASACGSSPADVPPMSMRVIEGSANILRGGERISVADQSSIEVGDRISVRRGIAEVRLEDGSVFELEDAVISVTGSDSLSLDSGNLLADLRSPANISADPVSIESSSGAFRVDRNLAIRVAVYRGEVELTGEGRELTISRYRQAVISGGVVPTAPSQMRLTSDRWDRRYLQPALDLDERLTNFGRGLEAQLGVLTGFAFFETVVAPGIDLDPLAPFLEMRRADLLIAMVIASESDGLGTLERVIRLWEDGGSWGLIAFELGVGQESLFGRLLEVVQRAGLAIVSRPNSTRSPGPGRTSPSPSPSVSRQPPPPSPPASPSPQAPVPSPVRSQVPPEEQETVDEVVCGLIGAVCSP